MHAIDVRGLRKSYGSVQAVDGVDFAVQQGEIFGLVGPNGAGKTTTVECMEGLRHPDEGEVTILGLDPWRDGYELRERIGVQLQESALPARLKVWEALDLFASFYGRSVEWKPLLERLGLEGKSKDFFGKLSGGQKQRVFIAMALINDPDVVFLDELTTGLDPQARRSMWELVSDIRERGKTVVLTTHFMEEAERLCDRVAIMDRGRIVVLDSPANLIAELDVEDKVIFTALDPLDRAVLQGVPGVLTVQRSGDRVEVSGRGARLVSGVVNGLDAAGVRFRHLKTEQPTLEDVFLERTGSVTGSDRVADGSRRVTEDGRWAGGGW